MLSRIIVVLTLVMTAIPAAAAPGDGSGSSAPAKLGPGSAAVKKANETLANLLKQAKPPQGSPAEKALAAKLTTGIRDFLDIDELGKAAMANQWSKLTKAQQEQFLKVLRDLIEANYINALRANLQYTVTYAGETTNKAGQTVVNTKITAQRKGRPYTIGIDYVLVKNGSDLRAFDIITDGVGLVDTYRQTFDKIITDKGFPALIQKMNDKLAKLNTASAAPSAPAAPTTPAPSKTPAKG